MKRLRWMAAMVAAAGLLAGCGEVSNTLSPPAGTANVITVALDAKANFTQVGIYEAEALGYFRQTDETVRFIVDTHPVDDLHDHKAQIAITTEPDIIIARNGHTALASVAAILQGPQHLEIVCRTKGSTPTGTTPATPGGTRTRTTETRTAAASRRGHPPLHIVGCVPKTEAHPVAAYAAAPTYNALNFVVTENEIINHAPLLRRFVQAVGRGYAAVKAHPAQATANMIKLNPRVGLNYTAELAGVRASLPDFFPSGSAANRPWGWQVVKDWNSFGTWLFDHHLITDVDATPDADTNELLAGQGV
jgi:ABC-type nitrate/sulfonate/bicarbonate transport system substrate-binding protein